MSTRVEFRWPDNLVATIDGVRGEVARSAFIREIVTKELARQGVPIWEAPKAPHDPVRDAARAVASHPLEKGNVAGRTIAAARKVQRYSCSQGCKSDSGGLCEKHRELLRKEG